MIKIMIADDHTLIREGLKKILWQEPDISVVCEAINGFEVFDCIKKSKVDLVLLDISMPKKSGLEVLKDLKYAYPEIPVLMLSMHPEDRFACRSFKSGANGYITKMSAADELVKAIRKIVSGEKYLSPALSDKFALQFVSGRSKPLHEILSDREYEVFYLITAGKKVNDISKELSLSLRTVYTYRARILQKLNKKSDTDLVLYAAQNDLIDQG